MQLTSAITWALLLASADAKQRKPHSDCTHRGTKTVWTTVFETEFGTASSQHEPATTDSIDASQTAAFSVSLSATASVDSEPAQVRKSTTPGSSVRSIPTSVGSANSTLTKPIASLSSETLSSSIIDATTSVSTRAALSSDMNPEPTLQVDATLSTTPSPSGLSSSSTTNAPTSHSALASISMSASTLTSASISTFASTSGETSSTTRPNLKPTTRPRAYPADVVDKIRDSSMKKLETHLQHNPAPGCTVETAAIRREWSDLTIAERQEYIDAIQCLRTKPARTPLNVAPGAKTRYDDFVVTHIEQTDSIHNTANFLTWHRYYTWAYETALRDECGYRGFQPYWNWDRYADDPANSPLFNGNASSIGGNSVNGGCAEAGPFEKLTVNLGPGASLHYNPRCLKRDISRSNAQQCTADKTFNLITESRTINDFQETMQTPWGVHAGGHFTVGGDPGGDIYVSPGDPAFFLHHAMIDRVYWIWQLQDLDIRQSAVAGNVAGTGRQGSLEDDVSLGYSGPAVALGSLLNTMGGKDGAFCYIYM